MSIQQNDLLSRGIDIPWKTFVRESGDVAEHFLEKKVHQLRFQGNEAKTAYEEIVTQETPSSQIARHKNFKVRASASQAKSNAKLISSGEKAKINQSSEEILLKITVNMIFKAVEEKDLKFLMKHLTQENVNSTDDFGWTPLMLAAYCGHLDVVEFLLSLGANKRAKEKSGLTAAQLALKKNYLSIVALLKRRTEYISNKASSVQCTDEISLQTRQESLDSLLTSCNGSTNKYSEQTKELPSKDNGFYCEICKATFQQATLKKHESSTLHIFNTKPKLPNAMYGISKQNKGYQMLLNTGWDEQGGLGPSGEGIKYPIKTCLKTDRKGIGQPIKKEYRVTHFNPGGTNATSNIKVSKQKCLKKRDREWLLSREARKERAIRIALS